MQIALGGDYRFAAEDCELVVMEARWGLIPDMGGTPGLVENVSGDHALRLAMTAESIDATTALSIGLVSRVSQAPMEDAVQLAKQLINRSPDTNETVKKMYHRIWTGSERAILAKETLNQIKILRGKNQRIAVKRETGDPRLPFEL